VFTNGSKDEQDINEWVVDPTFNAPDKNEIVNAYAAEYIRPSDGHLILVFGMERLDASGDAQIGFWFLQGVEYDSSTGIFQAVGGGTPHHAAGDTLVLSHFSNGGGPLPAIDGLRVGRLGRRHRLRRRRLASRPH
jgi:hypothetical protein